MFPCLITPVSLNNLAQGEVDTTFKLVIRGKFKCRFYLSAQIQFTHLLPGNADAVTAQLYLADYVEAVIFGCC